MLDDEDFFTTSLMTTKIRIIIVSWLKRAVVTDNSSGTIGPNRRRYDEGRR